MTTVHDSRLLKGTLKFGDTGSAGGAAEGQTTNVVIEQQDGDTEDVQYVLSGDSVGGETTPGLWHITGTLIQDFDAGTTSLQKWSYLNRGTTQPFTFTPNDVAGSPTITGQVQVSFLGLGGDVKTRITRDFDWAIPGEPVFGTWTTAVADVEHATDVTPTSLDVEPDSAGVPG